MKLFLLVLLIDIVTCLIDKDSCQQLLKYKNHTNASFIIAGLFPIHGHSTSSEFKYNHNGIVWSEAFEYYMNKVNNEILKTTSALIGFTIYDTCSEQNLALPATLEVVSTTEMNKDSCSCSVSRNKTYIGVIGDAASSISTVVSNVLSPLKMPQISYASTSVLLSRKHIHPSFLRTIPPDKFQVELIVNILLHFNWSFVSLIWSDDDYGRIALYDLLPALKQRHICVAVAQSFTNANKDLKQMNIYQTISKIKSAHRSNVIILWAQKFQALSFLEHADDMELYNKIWIGTESWSHHSFLLDLPPSLIDGLIAIKPYSGNVDAFIDYFQNKNITRSNHWIQHYFELRNQQADFNITSFRDILHEFSFSNVGFVRDAVFTMALAFKEYINTSRFTVTEILKRFSYEKYLHLLRNLRIKSVESVSHIKYDENGDVDLAMYNVFIIQRNTYGNLSFESLASWNSDYNSLKLKQVDIMWPGFSLQTTVSTCSDTCRPGFYRMDSSMCCWKCIQCPAGFYKNVSGNQLCLKCPFGTKPSVEQTYYIKFPDAYLKADSPFAVILYILSFIGVVFAMLFIFIFITNSDTPIVKSSNYIVSVIQLSSQIGLFIAPFILIDRPVKIMCILRPFLPGFLLVAIVSITFVKTEYLMSIFRAKSVLSSSNVKISKLLEASAILTICSLHVISCIVLNNFYPTEPMPVIDNDQVVLSCSNYMQHLYFNLSLALVLTVCVLIQAYRANKDLPATYNNAIHITYAMLSVSLCILLNFMLTISLSHQNQQYFVNALLIIFADYALLYWLYAHKIIAIVFRKKQNTAEEYRTKRFTHVYNSYATRQRKQRIQPVVRHHSVDMILSNHEINSIALLPYSVKRTSSFINVPKRSTGRERSRTFDY